MRPSKSSRRARYSRAAPRRIHRCAGIVRPRLPVREERGLELGLERRSRKQSPEIPGGGVQLFRARFRLGRGLRGSRIRGGPHLGGTLKAVDGADETVGFRGSANRGAAPGVGLAGAPCMSGAVDGERLSGTGEYWPRSRWVDRTTCTPRSTTRFAATARMATATKAMASRAVIPSDRPRRRRILKRRPMRSKAICRGDKVLPFPGGKSGHCGIADRPIGPRVTVLCAPSRSAAMMGRSVMHRPTSLSALLLQNLPSSGREGS